MGVKKIAVVGWDLERNDRTRIAGHPLKSRFRLGMAATRQDIYASPGGSDTLSAMVGSLDVPAGEDALVILCVGCRRNVSRQWTCIRGAGGWAKPEGLKWIFVAHGIRKHVLIVIVSLMLFAWRKDKIDCIAITARISISGQ